LQLASRYVPGDQGAVSGDWYDAFYLPGGEMAVVIGDAMGHGLRAAVVMGRLRSTLRAYAIESTDPADVLTRLDRKLQHFEPNELATVLYGIFDKSLATLRFASAGHAMPLLAAPDRPARTVDFPADPPLGAPPPTRRNTRMLAFPAGSLLLCFTDGLVERRDIPLDHQMDRLYAATTAGPPEKVCSAVVNALLGDVPPQDDVAVLAAWHHEESTSWTPAPTDRPSVERTETEDGPGTAVPPEPVSP
jgi:phosphoserine phosphatase RsbU/P